MAVVAMATACGGGGDDAIDDPPTTPPGKTDDGKGEVSMTISGSGAAGTGSAADPIVVEKGGTYSMSVSQRSTYTDPDGTTIVREPRASLSLAMTLDTVVCRDLKELTAMKDNIRTADSGSSPLLKNTVQTFNIGGQEIVFPTELPLPDTYQSSLMAVDWLVCADTPPSGGYINDGEGTLGNNVTRLMGYPARVVKHECKAKYLGKDFYWAVIDTIYQTTPLRVPPKSIRKISPESSRKFPPKTAWQQTKPKVTTRKRK